MHIIDFIIQTVDFIILFAEFFGIIQRELIEDIYFFFECHSVLGKNI